ncbi:MAG: histidinol dehydrogenase, partial [Paracoccaceae bacterium]
MSSLILECKIEIDKWLSQFISSSQDIFENYDSLVDDIIKNVKENGDEAIISLTNKFDNFKLTKDSFFFCDEEIDAAATKILKKEKEALELAASRIKKYHIKQLPNNKFWKDDMGVELGYRWNPITSIGIYVPGGLASYPSSVLMNAIPAKVAGVKKITMVTPTPFGKINPLVLYAAKISGVDKIIKIGGAQAIAALAYGTETIEAVDKIVGPGNSFVASAKRKVFGQVGIDSVAGPSEVLII